jgi:L,D-transpeptidase YbiS
MEGTGPTESEVPAETAPPDAAGEGASPALKLSRYPWLLAGAAATLATLALLFVLSSRIYVYDPVSALHGGAEPVDPKTLEPEDAKVVKKLQNESRQARRKLRSFAPRSLYIVVDTSENRLYVKKGEETLHAAACSTGSGGLLKDPDTGRQWIFHTPRGKFQVIRKAEDPVWTKPDWAFVEEGKPVPEKWSERRDHDTLGDYALYFGDGYMIHGTLYQRYLGQSITHGCVRLGDEDLERVYRMTPLGAPILIF